MLAVRGAILAAPLQLVYMINMLFQFVAVERFREQGQRARIATCSPRLFEAFFHGPQTLHGA